MKANAEQAGNLRTKLSRHNTEFPESGKTSGVRLLFVNLHTNLRGYIGGGGFAFVDLLASLSQTEAVTTVVLENLPSFAAVYGIHYDSVPLSGSMEYERFPGDKLPVLSTMQALKLMIKSIVVGARTVREKRIHILISPNERVPNIAVAFAISKLTRRQLIVMLHLLPCYEYALAALSQPGFDFRSVLSFHRSKFGSVTFPGLLNALARYIVSEFCRRSICITNNSMFVPILVRRARYNRVYTCPLAGIDAKKISSYRSPLKKYDAIYVGGQITKEKGILDALRVWRLVVEKRPRSKLVILGRASEETKIQAESLIASLELRQNVLVPYQFKAARTRDEIYSYMGESRVFLYPSVKDATPIVVMEALAAGLPVIMYDAAYARGVFESSEILKIIQTGDIESAACEVLKMIDADYTRLGDKSQEYSLRFENALITRRQVEALIRLTRQYAK